MPHPSKQKQNVGYRCRCTDGAPSSPQKRRFAALSDETLKDKESEITKKKRSRREMRVYFENIWVNPMNYRAGRSSYTKIYSEICNEDGELNKNSTLTNTRYGINILLSENNKERCFFKLKQNLFN